MVSDIRTIEEEMLVALGDQTTAGKSTSKTGKDILELRKKVREEELTGVEIQNEMAKLQVRGRGGVRVRVRGGEAGMRERPRH